eukprot:41137_1
MRMFEQIVNGYFIDDRKEAERALSVLFNYVLRPTMMERINAMIAREALTQLLLQEEYDTDSIIDDLEDLKSSNLVHENGLSESQQTKIQQCTTQREESNPPAYITQLFLNYVASLKQRTIWLNSKELANHECIQNALLGDDKLLDRFKIDKLTIQSTKEYIWEIKDHEYKAFLSKKPREYIKSKKYCYEEGDTSVTFHLECYPKYSDVSQTCAIFFHLDTMGTEA